MRQYSVVAVREDNPKLSDLVEKARSGDRESFDQVIRLIEKPVLKTALCLTGNLADAEDVAQDVYVKVISRIETLGEEGKLCSWALRITANTARDHFRRSKKLIPLEVVSLWKHPAKSVEEREFHSRLVGALNKLTFKERSVFVFKEIHAFDTREVADILGCLPVTVRTHLHSARRKLRKLLSDFREAL
jgi:RNA polymerase sigma-70 factor (ECF subfamily)